MLQHLTCALVQMNSGDNWKQNLDDATSAIHRAIRRGASLIVLPENVLCFGASAIDSFAPHVDDCIAQLQALSDDFDVFLICGSVPVRSSDDAKRYRSRSYFLSPGAKPVSYDKVHLFDVDVSDGVGAYRESDTYEAGDQPVLVDVLGRKLGLSICYDLRFPELYQEYQRKGVELISVPAAFTYTTGKAHWEILLRARAIETQSFILAANQCGTHGGNRETWGHSMIVAPDGNILSSCGAEPGLCVADLDFNLLRQVRTAMPLSTHKRLI